MDVDHLTWLDATYVVPEYYIGSLISNEWIESRSSDRIFNLCSISKLVTAVLVLKMVSKKWLTLNSKVEEFIPSFAYHSVSVEQLLRHTSGICDDEHRFAGHVPLEEAYLLEQIVFKDPGQFNYSDHGYMLLQVLAERCYHKPFEQIMDEEIFSPLGLTSFHYINDRDEINEASHVVGYDVNDQRLSDSYSVYPFPAAAGLWGSGHDLMLFIQEILAGLQGNSKLALSKLIYSHLIETPELDYFGLGCFVESSKLGPEVYSLGWGVGYQSMVLMYPQCHSSLIVLTNKDFGVHQMKGFCGQIYARWFRDFE